MTVIYPYQNQEAMEVGMAYRYAMLSKIIFAQYSLGL